MRGRLIAIIILSIVGVAISTYSFLHHQAVLPGTWCDLSATFNCDTVNRGPFSEIAGIPVALIGIIGYLFLVIAAALRLKQPEDKGLRVFLILAATGGFLFSLYLTGVETVVLQVWCPVCLTSQVVMLSIFILSVWKQKQPSAIQ